ncbi:MAG: nucleotidyltransferase domain-containing protein [Candidatus Schekmanbacteria bacterium]|nr:nucleotidyltransferase domain-containing protein [Candidatus Schekmanbacteria bacterium]
MNEKDKLIISEFKNRLSPDLQCRVKRLIVFGSRVRGDAEEDSDLDVIALVDERATDIEKKLEDTAYQVMWDFDFKPFISLKVFSEEQFYDALKKGFSFYQHVEREGISL